MNFYLQKRQTGEITETFFDQIDLILNMRLRAQNIGQALKALIWTSMTFFEQQWGEIAIAEAELRVQSMKQRQ